MCYIVSSDLKTSVTTLLKMVQVTHVQEVIGRG